MKHLTLSIFCMLAVGFIGLSSTGCGTNDVVNQRQNSGLTIGSISSGKVFSSVDQMPIFPGGEEALMQYLSAHIRYPKEAREDGLSGTVIVQFIVNKDGNLSNLAIVGKPIGGGLEEESVKVIQNMPKWIPGSEKGVKVNVQYALPIRYELQ